MRIFLKPALELAEGALKSSTASQRAGAKMADEVIASSVYKLERNGLNPSLQLPRLNFTGPVEKKVTFGRKSTEFKAAPDPYRNNSLVEGELVGVIRFGRIQTASIFKLGRYEDMAIVKPVSIGRRPPSREVTVDPADLKQIDKRLFTDRNGRVFSSRKNLNLDDMDEAETLILNPSLLAVKRSKLKSFDPPREISNLTERTIAVNKKLIENYSGNSKYLLAAIDSAPKIHFGSSSIFAKRPLTAFNPLGGNTNCMGCTAAVFRSLKEGRLYNANDIANLTQRSGFERLGNPSPGRFKNEHEALEWFQTAANANIKRVGNVDSIPGGTSFAVVIKPSARKMAEPEHMIFGHRFNDGRTLFYDAQKGVAYPWRSLDSNGNSVSIFQLTPKV